MTPLRPEPVEVALAAGAVVPVALCLAGVVMVLRGRWTVTQGIVWIALALLVPNVGGADGVGRSRVSAHAC